MTLLFEEVFQTWKTFTVWTGRLCRGGGDDCKEDHVLLDEWNYSCKKHLEQMASFIYWHNFVNLCVINLGFWRAWVVLSISQGGWVHVH